MMAMLRRFWSMRAQGCDGWSRIIRECNSRCCTFSRNATPVAVPRSVHLRDDPQNAADLIALEADAHRSADARDHRDVVKLLDRPGDAHPVHGVARAQIDHLDS